MLLRWRTALGLILAITLFAAFIPLLTSLESYPRDVFFGEDVFTLSQVRSDAPLNVSLVDSLRSETWIQQVSPEIFVFTLLGGEPTIARGVDPPAFLSIEGVDLPSGGFGEDFTLAGERISARFGLSVGDGIALVGSTVPLMYETTVTGVFSTVGPSSDELLLPLDDARRLAGLGGDNVLTVRVMTAEGHRLAEFLESLDVPVLVGTGGQDPIALSSNETVDGSILRLAILSPELAAKIDRSFVSAFAQQGVNSVGTVVWGFIVLTSMLTFIGIASTLARALFEKRRDVGILSALGANRMRIRGLLFVELAKVSAVAAILGSLLGFGLSASIGATNLVVLFGHVVEPAFTPLTMALIVLTTGVGSCITGMAINEFAFKWRPTQLIHEADRAEEEAQSLEEVLSS